MIRMCAWAANLAVVVMVLGAAVASGLTLTPDAAAPGGNLPVDPPLPARTGVWPVNLTFYGNASLGWGFSNATIREPGPPLLVLWGTKVTLTLIGHDLADHSWFIDYNDDKAVSPAEPVSPIFNSPVGKVVVWPFIADQTGNWTYRCGVHPFSMTGSISIVGGPPAELPRAS